ERQVLSVGQAAPAVACWRFRSVPLRRRSGASTPWGSGGLRQAPAPPLPSGKVRAGPPNCESSGTNHRPDLRSRLRSEEQRRGAQLFRAPDSNRLEQVAVPVAAPALAAEQP